jgi:hypothetical protein
LLRAYCARDSLANPDSVTLFRAIKVHPTGKCHYARASITKFMGRIINDNIVVENGTSNPWFAKLVCLFSAKVCILLFYLLL